jgi:hypothetical protein
MLFPHLLRRVHACRVKHFTQTHKVFPTTTLLLNQFSTHLHSLSTHLLPTNSLQSQSPWSITAHSSYAQCAIALVRWFAAVASPSITALSLVKRWTGLSTRSSAKNTLSSKQTGPAPSITVSSCSTQMSQSHAFSGSSSKAVTIIPASRIWSSMVSVKSASGMAVASNFLTTQCWAVTLMLTTSSSHYPRLMTCVLVAPRIPVLTPAS